MDVKIPPAISSHYVAIVQYSLSNKWPGLKELSVKKNYLTLAHVKHLNIHFFFLLASMSYISTLAVLMGLSLTSPQLCTACLLPNQL